MEGLPMFVKGGSPTGLPARRGSPIRFREKYLVLAAAAFLLLILYTAFLYLPSDRVRPSSSPFPFPSATQGEKGLGRARRQARAWVPASRPPSQTPTSSSSPPSALPMARARTPTHSGSPTSPPPPNFPALMPPLEQDAETLRKKVEQAEIPVMPRPADAGAQSRLLAQQRPHQPQPSPDAQAADPAVRQKRDKVKSMMKFAW